MRRCVMLCLTLVLASACQGDDATRPKLDPASSPSALISDGNHSGGNPDFFFLPPLVRDPKTLGGVPNPLWDIGGANASLTPTVRICELDVVATSAGKVATLPTETTPCKAGTGVYDVTTTLTASNVSRGILDDTDIDNAVTRFLTHYSSFVEPYYHLGWKVPAAPIGTTKPPAFYRITVKVGSSKTLGILDVESVNNFTQLLNVKTNEFVPLTGSLRVPVNFRIERYALCETPGAATCSSVSGDITVAPLTVSTGTADPSGVSTTVGVLIPKQTLPTSTPVTVTITSCPNLNPAVIDLRTFGNCSRVTTDPVLPRLTTPATIFICAVGVSAGMFQGLSEEQEVRVTLHRYDATGDHAGVVALPHAHACLPGLPGGTVAIKPSFGGMLAKLSHGEFKRAATEAVALIAPKPLYAAMFIDQGGGGLTDLFSDFQFALPAKLDIVESTNNRSVSPGTVISPTVLVTDLGGDPVAGAVVHFFTSDPSETNGTPVTTGADGLASAPWTVAAGTQHVSASGRGIASPASNGPRRGDSEGDAVFDPFQPIQSPFDAGFSGTPVETALRTGAVQFSATGITLFGSSPGRGPSVADPNPGSLFALNITSGLASLIGSTGINGGDGEPELSAITFHPTTGALYGIIGSNCTGAKLVTINPSTGAADSVGTLIGTGFDGVGHAKTIDPPVCYGGSDALAFASDGSLYASGWNGGTTGGGKLLKVNPTTGAVLALNATTGGIAISGLAFSPSGVLWASRGANGGGGVLHTIAPATGATLSTLTLKNAAGANEIVIVSDLVFGADGTLYVSLPSEGKLATVNVSTGVLTRIGNFSSGEIPMKIAGLAIRR